MSQLQKLNIIKKMHKNELTAQVESRDQLTTYEKMIGCSNNAWIHNADSQYLCKKKIITKI